MTQIGKPIRKNLRILPYSPITAEHLYKNKSPKSLDPSILGRKKLTTQRIGTAIRG